MWILEENHAGRREQQYKVSEARPCLGPMWLQESQTRERRGLMRTLILYF